jgi:small-conductance mechanosensitive channel
MHDLWTDLLAFLNAREGRAALIATGILIVAVVVTRTAVLRFVRRASKPGDAMRLKWTVQVKRLSFVVFAFGIVLIWASQLEALAVSLVAVAAALVLATKELIMCISGAALRTAASSYRVGDRIEIAGTRGDVIEYGLLSTTILEVGPAHKRTGRAVTIPNSVLVTEKVINESYTKAYVLHTITVPVDREDDWHRAEEILQAAATEVCAEYIASTQRSLDEVASSHGIDPTSAEPTVYVVLPNADTVNLVARVPALASEKGRVEQAILRRYLEGLAVEGRAPEHQETV